MGRKKKLLTNVSGKQQRKSTAKPKAAASKPFNPNRKKR